MLIDWQDGALQRQNSGKSRHTREHAFPKLGPEKAYNHDDAHQS